MPLSNVHNFLLLNIFLVQTKQIETDDKAKSQGDKINEIESTLLLLKSLSGGGNSGDGGAGIIDQLEILIENLRKECYAKFADRDDFTNLKRRVAELEREYTELNKTCENQDISITACRDITDTNKLDIDELKKLLKALQNSYNAGN